MENNIELELRGECTGEFEALKEKLDHLSAGRREVRTMVMFFGEVAGKQVDIRCRVTNGEAEVVAKMGDYHAHDRQEVSVDVDVNQLVSFSHLFAAMGFSNAKVGTRESWEYHIDGIDVSLVRGMSNLAYIEFEKIVSEDQLEDEKPKLEALANRLGVKLWQTGEEYYAFCQLLTDNEDWRFTGSEVDLQRLRDQL